MLLLNFSVSRIYLSGLLNPDPLVSPSNIRQKASMLEILLSNELRDMGEGQEGKGGREGIKRR